MNFLNKLSNTPPTLSFEFFPPKTPNGLESFYQTVKEIGSQNPDFISITYGAGGSTREQTVELTKKVNRVYTIDCVSHLTCVNHSKKDLDVLLKTMWNNGIRTILALRGDLPQGQTQLNSDFSYASDLISFIRKNFDFNIGCACYPEKHSEAQTLEQDIQNLKLKQEQGASFAITQLFFDNTLFYNFCKKVQQQGVSIPIIAGIMPVSSYQQLDKFESMCACSIPNELRENLKVSETPIQVGVDWAVSQCTDLVKNNVSGIHLYTLNKSKAPLEIVQQLKVQKCL